MKINCFKRNFGAGRGFFSDSRFLFIDIGGRSSGGPGHGPEAEPGPKKAPNLADLKQKVDDLYKAYVAKINSVDESKLTGEKKYRFEGIKSRKEQLKALKARFEQIDNGYPAGNLQSIQDSIYALIDMDLLYKFDNDGRPRPISAPAKSKDSAIPESSEPLVEPERSTEVQVALQSAQRFQSRFQAKLKEYEGRKDLDGETRYRLEGIVSRMKQLDALIKKLNENPKDSTFSVNETLAALERMNLGEGVDRADRQSRMVKPAVDKEEKAATQLNLKVKFNPSEKLPPFDKNKPEVIQAYQTSVINKLLVAVKNAHLSDTPRVGLNLSEWSAMNVLLNPGRMVEVSFGDSTIVVERSDKSSVDAFRIREIVKVGDELNGLSQQDIDYSDAYIVSPNQMAGKKPIFRESLSEVAQKEEQRTKTKDEQAKLDSARLEGKVNEVSPYLNKMSEGDTLILEIKGSVMKITKMKDGRLNFLVKSPNGRIENNVFPNEKNVKDGVLAQLTADTSVKFESFQEVAKIVASHRYLPQYLKNEDNLKVLKADEQKLIEHISAMGLHEPYWVPLLNNDSYKKYDWMLYVKDNKAYFLDNNETVSDGEPVIPEDKIADLEIPKAARPS